MTAYFLPVTSGGSESLASLFTNPTEGYFLVTCIRLSQRPLPGTLNFWNRDLASGTPLPSVGSTIYPIRLQDGKPLGEVAIQAQVVNDVGFPVRYEDGRPQLLKTQTSPTLDATGIPARSEDGRALLAARNPGGTPVYQSGGLFINTDGINRTYPNIPTVIGPSLPGFTKTGFASQALAEAYAAGLTATVYLPAGPIWWFWNDNPVSDNVGYGAEYDFTRL